MKDFEAQLAALKDKDLKERIGHNVDGWRCLQHRDGWLVGDDEGVICYQDEVIARAANTIANAREGRLYGQYKLIVYSKELHLHKAGEHTPKLSIKEIEGQF